MTPAAETPPDREDSTQVWTTAKKEVRDVARWIATAMGAVAAVVFGAGPLVGSFKNLDGWRVAAIAGGAIVGISGTAYVIRKLAAILAPTAMSLGGLPAEFQNKINENRRDYLFDDSVDLNEFASRWEGWRVTGSQLRDQKQLAEERVAAAKAALAAAELEERPARNAELDEAKAGLQSLNNVIADADAWLERYGKNAKGIVAQGSFEQVRATYDANTNRALAAAVIAVIGGVLYVGGLQSGTGDVSTAAAAPTPVVVTVTSQPFTDALGLDACLTDSTATMLRHSGKGTTEDPWDLETIAVGSCAHLRFRASNAVAVVNEAGPAVVSVSISGAEVAILGHIVANPVQDQSTLVGTSVGLDIGVTGGPGLHFTAEGLPSGLIIDPTSGRITGQPTEPGGPQPVAITVTYPRKRVVTILTFAWTVGDR